MANPAKDARDKAQANWPGATVLVRKRKSITHQHPTNPNRFMFDAEIGPMHYGPAEDQEIDTAWQSGTAPWDYEMDKAGYNAYALQRFDAGQIIKYVDPDTGEDIAFQPQQLQYTNDLDQIQPIEDPQNVNAVVTDDVLYWAGAFGSDIDLKWHAQTARLDKRVIVHNAAALPTVQQFIIDGGNPVLRLQFIFQKSTNVEIWVNGVLWDEKANNPVETSGYIEWKHATTGEVLWVFNLPRSFAPNELDAAEIIGTFRLRKTGPNLFVEHRIPIDWLQSTVYPIEIDTTVDEQVGTGADDGTWKTLTDDFTSSENAVVTGWDSADSLSNLRRPYFRFADVTIAAGATINTGTPGTDGTYATIVGQETLSSRDVDVLWRAVDTSGTPAAPTQFSEIEDSSIARTTANQSENLTAATDGDDKFSPDIANVIQELFDSYTASFTGGTADIILCIDDVSSPQSPGYNRLKWSSYENDTSEAGKLHIEYTAAAAGNPWYAYAQQ